jgi:carbonic anhydrase/acetyltransferase-like protein (isoleucine patch superfamily)
VAILHADPGFPAVLGARVTVGHGATVHGARVQDECLIGMGSVLLNGAEIGTGSLIAAGAVVLEGTEIPPGSLVAGVPGKVRRSLTPEEQEAIGRSWSLRRAGGPPHGPLGRALSGPRAVISRRVPPTACA